jgi:hypothetical protein
MGETRRGWRFKGKTPLWFTLTAFLLIADSVAHFAMLATLSSWAQQSPDLAHTYRLPFRDGHMYFVDPHLGRYLDTKWIGIALFILLIALLLVNREQIERSE